MLCINLVAYKGGQLNWEEIRKQQRALYMKHVVSVVNVQALCIQFRRVKGSSLIRQLGIGTLPSSEPGGSMLCKIKLVLLFTGG